MVDLRLLSLLVAVAGFSALGCASAVSPALAGRVVDGDSDASLEGVEVFAFLEAEARMPWPVRSRAIGHRWTTTDQEGRFVLQESVAMKRFPWWSVRLDDRPTIILAHPDYGAPARRAPEDRSEWDHLELKLVLDPGTQLWMQDPDSWSRLCIGLEGPACKRMCQFAYGDATHCEYR